MNIYTWSFQSEWLTSLVFFFGVKKERKKLWGDASPKPRCPWRSGQRGQQKTINKRVLRSFGSKPFLLSFVFCVAWNEKFVKSKWICVRLHTNSWQTFLFHAGLQIRRVKAKNASTLKIKISYYFNYRNCCLFEYNGSGREGVSPKAVSFINYLLIFTRKILSTKKVKILVLTFLLLVWKACACWTKAACAHGGNFFFVVSF